ncbi:MAG TPA: (d)CMP kinase [Gammaproteobacteria bacterium]|nr:(d)CMP kinase [Gammaproteobacteria bacterium]
MPLQPSEKIISLIEKKLSGRNTPLLIALDGRSGTGKSSLAKTLANKFSATLIESDDFYCGRENNTWASCSPEEKVAQCIDWRRLRAEALMPLLEGKTAHYHPYDFKTGAKFAQHSVTLQPSKIIILDGAYSARPELSDLVDIRILVESSDDVRRNRLLHREGTTFMEEWHSIWDVAEEYYFTEICPLASFDVVVKN